MDRRTVLTVIAIVLAFALPRAAAAIPELIPTVPIPENGYTGEGREILCTVEEFDPGRVKYDFVADSFYVQDFDGCYYILHIEEGRVVGAHD